jgi:two-component system, NtrC family, sensor kinase
MTILGRKFAANFRLPRPAGGPMRAPEFSVFSPGRWRRFTRSLSAKLIVLLVAALVVIFGLYGYLTVRLHRQHLETATLGSAERVSDVIKRSTSYYMLHNDRQGLHYLVEAIAHEPGMVRIRVFNQEGRISYSTDRNEINSVVNKGAEACYGCHARAQPLTRLNRPDRFRIYRLASGERVLGIINPIENSPACSNAACHAHPASQQILGVLDTNLSLAGADRSLAESSRHMFVYMLLAVALISSLSGLFIWRVVHGPLKVLEEGTERLASGALGYQIAVRSQDELGELAGAFNTMSRQLREARQEVIEAARELESRVEQKTRELGRANEQMLQAEKMASIGKLAAIVAHEINNPLTGILTYAKLLRKWMAGCEGAKREQIRSSLELIESESRRCGEIVKSLLTFARTAPMNPQPSDLNAVVERAVRLVRHQLDLAGIELQRALGGNLPTVTCDAAHIEQVFLALMMNAVEAMPRGGKLLLRSRYRPSTGEVQLDVQDDGVGIPPEVLPHLFEPFFTTREHAHGLGLGLAISQGIIERHHGRIEAASQPGRGTTFTITLPVQAGAEQSPPAPPPRR